MLTTKKGARGVHILFLVCCAIFLFSGCGEPGPKALLEGERLIKEGKYNDAILHLQEAVQLLPQNAQAWNHLGLAYHYSGQPSKAVENYKRALEINGNLAAARYNLGQLYFEQGRYAAAAADFTTYVILEPKNGDAWKKLATAQLRHSHQVQNSAERARWLNSARQNFEIALQFEQDPHIYNSLGYIEVLRGRPRDSVRYFNLALQKQRNYPPAMLNLAIVHHAYLGDRRTALQRYREFLASQPRSERFREVEAAARQIELELNPPQYVTNLVSQVLTAPRQATTATTPPPAAQTAQPTQTTQPAPPAATSQPQVVKENKPEPRVDKPVPPAVTRTEPAPKPEQTTPPPQQSKPAVTPAPTQTEVVKLTEDKPVVPAREVPTAPETPTASTPVAVAPKAQETQVVDAATAAASESEETSSKPRLIQRLNPASWFRDRTNEPAPRKVETAAAPVQQKTNTPPPAPVTRAPEPQQTRAPIPRYRYSTAAAPKAGNRREATRLFNEALQAHQHPDSVLALELYRRATQADPSFFEAHYNLGLIALERKLTGEAIAAYEMALQISPDSDNARYNFAHALQRGGYLLDAAAELEKLIARNPRDTRAHLSLANVYSQIPGNNARARMHYQKVLELDPNHPQAAAIRYWLRDNP